MGDKLFLFFAVYVQLKDSSPVWNLQINWFINSLVRNSQSRAAFLYRVVVKGFLRHLNPDPRGTHPIRTKVILLYLVPKVLLVLLNS